ncbi:hypothetical protein PCASD_22467 [Puccinia coronata f. sp. avenae]|uniref:Uncharacterized protein n=1 Tax=Puccinia coronata f. sp. avenae TaxID=200324 RepID=A0A2N5SHZ6_9BASI|nr:hypothetical protein PCASD_22467 [Puccinia coronata f. sp. avenae]
MEITAELTNADHSMDVDSDPGNPSSRRNWRAQSDQVLRQFDKLLADYDNTVNPPSHHSRKHRAIDQLDDKVVVLHLFRTKLLPSIKHQLVALLQSLDLSEHSTYPCPNPELTAKVLSKMRGTLCNVIAAVENLTRRPPLSELSHDRHLNDFKQFRMDRTQWKTQRVIYRNLAKLFETCAEWIVSWKLQDDPNDLEFQAQSLNTRNQIFTLAVDSRISIDELLEWSKLPDLAILQDEWRGSTQRCNKMLQAFSEILNGTCVWRQRVNENEQGNNQEEKTARQTGAIQLARSIIPIVKLTRLFYSKLCNTRLPFTLDPEISSGELHSLREKMDLFDGRIGYLLDRLCLSYETGENIATWRPLLRKFLLDFLVFFDDAFLALAFHIAPLHAVDNYSALHRDFKTWFLPLQNQFRLATTNLRDTAHLAFEEEDRE